jgi:hypothetical protein
MNYEQYLKSNEKELAAVRVKMADKFKEIQW